MWVSVLPGIVSTSTANGCQLFCPIQSFVCQGRPINNSSAARLLTDQIISRPVLEEPNLYARKIITHFNHLFVPRKGEGKPTDLSFCFVNLNLNLCLSLDQWSKLLTLKFINFLGCFIHSVSVPLEAEGSFSNLYVNFQCGLSFTRTQVNCSLFVLLYSLVTDGP